MLKSFLKCWKAMNEFHGVFFGVVGFVLIQQGIGLVWPIVYGKVIDSIWTKDWLGAVTAASIGLAVDLLANLLGFKEYDFESQKFDYDAPRKMIGKILTKYLSFSIGQHVNTHSGIKMAIMNEGRKSLIESVELFIYDVLPTSATFIFVSLYLTYRNPYLGGVVILGGILFLYSVMRLNRKIRPDLEKERDEEHKLQKERLEIINNAALISLNSQAEKLLNKHDSSLVSFGVFAKNVWRRYVLVNMLVNHSIPKLTRYAVVMLGTYFVFRGLYGPGLLVTALALASQAIGRLGTMGYLQRRLLNHEVKIDKLFAMMAVESDIKVVENPICPELFKGDIEFRDVEFAYESRSYVGDDEEEKRQEGKGEPILKNVSFKIRAGERVAIIGDNGAGKSTLFHLILRSYDPDKGQVLVDGNDLRLLDLHRYHQYGVGHVEQDVRLFDNSLRQNILFGLNGRGSTVTDSELMRIADISRIASFYGKLEKGFDTLVGEKGVRLSGGQVKMVGIARAIIKNPAILLFDEATAGLDQKNEAVLCESLDQAAKGRTTLIITHRLSTIQNVDRILVFSEGGMAGEGSHEYLLRNCEPYRSFLKCSAATF